VKKKRLLNMMGQICASADLTVVAAAGKDDQSGLPGSGTLLIIHQSPRPVAYLREYAFIPCLNFNSAAGYEMEYQRMVIPGTATF